MCAVLPSQGARGMEAGPCDALPTSLGRTLLGPWSEVKRTCHSAGSFSVRRGVAYWGEKAPTGVVPQGVLLARHAPHAPNPLAQVQPHHLTSPSVTCSVCWPARRS